MPTVSPWVRVFVIVQQDNAQHPTSLARINSFTSSLTVSAARTRHIGNVARAAGHPLPDLAATQTVGLIPLPADAINLIRDLTDLNPCETDPTGGCITHGVPAGRGPCPHGQAQQLLRAWHDIDPADRQDT